MTTMFCRALSSGMRSPFSGMNFWMVVKTTPPLATCSSSRRCSRPAACTGVWPRMSWQRWNWPKSWSSRSLRSVSTTSVGFCIAGCRTTRAAKKSIEKLLPLPWVCQTTPARSPGRPVHAARARPAQRVGHAAGAHRLLHRGVHRVELVVARDDLVQRALSGSSSKTMKCCSRSRKRCGSNTPRSSTSSSSAVFGASPRRRWCARP
jgi:hypothetical protein